MYKPSNIAVRVLYCICLLAPAIETWRPLYNFFGTLFQPGHVSAINYVIIAAPSLAGAGMAALLVYRFFGVAIGRMKLCVRTDAGHLIRLLRIAGISLMVLKAAPALLVAAIALLSQKGEALGIVFILANIGANSTVALLLFEGSRLLERELAPSSAQMSAV